MHLLPEPTEHGPVQITLDIVVVYSNSKPAVAVGSAIGAWNRNYSSTIYQDFFMEIGREPIYLESMEARHQVDSTRALQPTHSLTNRYDEPELMHTL